MAFRTLLLNGVTTGASVPQTCDGVRDMTLYLSGAGTISAGTLLVEEAAYDPTGRVSPTMPPAVWSSVTGSNPIDCTEVTAGGCKAYQLPPGAYAQVRVLVGTTVSGSGGKIYVTLVGV